LKKRRIGLRAVLEEKKKKQSGRELGSVKVRTCEKMMGTERGERRELIWIVLRWATEVKAGKQETTK